MSGRCRTYAQETRNGLTVAIPEYFLAILHARQDAGDDEQQIGQTVQIADDFGSHSFLCGK